MLYDLIIIGADSAGLSAGIYAGRKKINTLILSEKLGGQSVYTDSIENYPGFLKVAGAELISRFKDQVNKFGASLKIGERVESIIKSGDSIFLVKTNKEEYQTKSVIIATGRVWRKLGVPGEMEFISKGVSFCAICDAPFFANKEVAIVGGGNSAFESANDLLQYASKIYIIHHREEFKGDKDMFDKLKINKKVEFIVNAETKEIKGEKFVNSLIYEDIKTKEAKELKVEGVFINIGQVPNSSFVKDFVELSECCGEIKIDPRTNMTSVEGIFAAGDVSNTKYKQVVIAAAEGAKSVLSVDEFLKKK